MELKQANSVRKDILFKKIGVDVALHEGSCAFKDPIPSKGLAVSNRFGITFFVHSEGEYSTFSLSLMCLTICTLSYSQMEFFSL